MWERIDWTTVMSSAVVAAVVGVIVGVFQLIANRYTARILDKVDKLFSDKLKEKEKKNEDPNSPSK